MFSLCEFISTCNAELRRKVIRLPYKESDTGSSPVLGTKFIPLPKGFRTVVGRILS